MNGTPSRADQVISAVEDIAFGSFGKNDGYALGCLIADRIVRDKLDLAVEIILNGHHIFRAVLNDCDPDTDEWLAGKAAVARDAGVPSLAVQYRCEDEGPDRLPVDALRVDYRISGGSMPILVRGAVRGTVTLSGINEVVEHELAVSMMREFLRGR